MSPRAEAQRIPLDARERLLAQLRQPGVEADRLIHEFLGHSAPESKLPPYTREVEVAMTLLPRGVHFLCGRFEEGTLFWCDVGFRPQVQAWGENLAAAIAGAAVAYLTHPDRPPADSAGASAKPSLH